ncbi:hypothetical protein QBC46DRAFT_375705 [Diplogelasinospora grovesii]|uniref:Uncharacterized protein n=1 Tax=Diplogelasinospora grovesii TaxID=303347 RepID=A0AAN6NDS8_9PEZI|nr:hypothetical protein QBC46DRAFT_375705 [Diplogelasinospora grovesii]
MGPRQALGSSLVGRHFQPPGSSPVHTQTQQASAASLGRTGQPASERMSMEHAVSPLSNVPQSAATASSVYSGGPGYGHAAVVSPTSRRMSPAPQGAGPVSTRFPPRKSSMGPYDAPDFVDSARQSVSSSGPGSSHKPWVEARSAPPSSAKSPVSPTSKPLPFIRPSDIYRRMEEEKEKERRSMDSGRPSLDNVFGRGNERVQSPARAQAETGDQKWQAGVGLEEGAECNRSPSVGLGLAPVAERKSEYGIEGLLASYESEEPTIAPASSAQDQTRPPGQSAELRQFTQSLGPEKPLLSQPSVQFDSEEDKSRRFSTSPKLPDLARMSVFGEDLFSRSSKFISDAPPVPAIPNQPEFSRMAQSPTHLAEPSAADKKPALLDNADPPGQLHETSTTHAMSAVSAFPNAESVLEQTTPQNSDDAAESDVLFPRTQDASPAPSPSAEANQRVELPSDRDRSNVTQPAPNASNQQVRVAMTPQQAASATEGKPAFRPSLPGAWVSETVTTPGGLFAPEPSQTLHTTADKAAEAGDVSPMTEGNENTGNSSSGVGKTQLAASDGVSDEVSEASVAKRPMPVSVSSHPASPHSLPPLRTASPALSTSLQMDPISTGTEDNNANNHQPAELTSPIPTTATTTHSEIPFTAPLNPRKDLHEASITPQDFGTLPSILTSSTLDTSSSSPVKESDLLREEIMKSLSPLQSCSEIPEITRPSTAADRQPEHHPRESTYLPDDVYGDYWDSGDDRPDEGVPSPVKGDNEPATTAGVSPSPFDQISKDYGVPGLKSSPHPASDSPSDASPEAHPRPLARFGELRRRFSWESGAEDANAVNAKAQAAGSQVEQKTLGSGLGNLAAATPTVASPEPGTGPSDGASPAMAHLASGPKLDTIPVHNQGETSGMSHQVSQPSTLPSRSTLDATIEPPSPVSTVAERNASPAGNHRLSLAEEKALVHTSVSPISPTPPPEQHPAFAERSHELPQTLGPPATPAKQEVVNIIAFRQIMELPSSAERTKYFNQNRWKYASLEVGLSQWLSALSQHPDHVNATSLFNTALPGPAASTSAQQSTQVQAPYYQQYLNASSSALAQAGRPSGTYMLNMPMPPPQHGASGFGQSGNQVGTKSKELLMAAGKAGKGLLSKGKNKLRNTGDKVFSNS